MRTAAQATFTAPPQYELASSLEVFPVGQPERSQTSNPYVSVPTAVTFGKTGSELEQGRPETYRGGKIQRAWAGAPM